MRLSRVDKIKYLLFFTLRGIVLIACVISAILLDWSTFFLSVVSLLTLFLPSILEKKLSVDFPSEFEILVIIFAFSAMYLGEVKSYYFKYWWWDVFLHSLSALLIGAIGFSLVDILNKNKKVAINLSPLFVSIFSFCFALSIGAIWEIYEYLVDTWFGLNMQKSGLIDTMEDLIVDAFGALVFSILGYLYLKGKINILDRFVGKRRDWSKDQRVNKRMVIGINKNTFKKRDVEIDLSKDSSLNKK